MPFEDRTETGTIDANGEEVKIHSPGMSTVAVQITGTWNGIIAFAGTNDQGNWITATGTNFNTGVRQSNSSSTNGLFIFNVAGLVLFRAVSTSWTSGSATVTINASEGVTSAGIGSGTGSAVDTELPAAAALADATANPTTPLVGAANEVYNGTTWDRARSANGAANTTGTGLIGAGILAFDGTNYQLLRSDASNNLLSGIRGSTGNQVSVTSSADAMASGTALFHGASYGIAFNGTSWDRIRNNIDATALASAARTTTQNVAFTNYNGRAIDVVLDVTTAGTGSITLTIQGTDAVSGKMYTLLAGAAVTTISTNVYRVGPGLTAAANSVANFYLPRSMNILVTHNNANSITYSVGYSLVCA